MKKFYSLLKSSGTPEQSGNYIGSFQRQISYIIGLVVLGIGIFTACIFEGFAVLYFFICGCWATVCNSKPSIFHTMPVNYKKRTLYYFVDLLILTFIVCLVIVAEIAIAIGLDMIIETIQGIPVIEDNTDVEDSTVVAISSAAVLFSLFRTLFFCGAITGIARIENKKYYLIGSLALLFVYAGGGLCLTLAAAKGSEFVSLLWFYQNFENLPLPWLATILCTLFAVAAWVGSILYVLKVEKPKAF